MRYTVLGSTGFIGRELAAFLRNAYCPTRFELRNIAAGNNLGHVFYCLGSDKWNEDPYDAVEGHVGHLAWILKHCRFESVTYISSNRIYLGEVDLFNRLKLTGETIALSHPSTYIVRPSSIIGPVRHGTSLIPGLVLDAVRRGVMNLHIAPDSTKDFITIEDTVKLLHSIAERGKKRLYDIVSGQPITIAEIVKCIQSETGAKAIWHGGPTILHPVISTWPIADEFGFYPTPILPRLAAVCHQAMSEAKEVVL